VHKIATKTIATLLEKDFPSIIHPSQPGYIKGTSGIGKSIRQIADIMDFTKHLKIPGIAMILDLQKAFDSHESDYIQKSLLTFNFGSQLRQWISVFYSRAPLLSKFGNVSSHEILVVT